MRRPRNGEPELLIRGAGRVQLQGDPFGIGYRDLEIEGAAPLQLACEREGATVRACDVDPRDLKLGPTLLGRDDPLGQLDEPVVAGEWPNPNHRAAQQVLAGSADRDRRRFAAHIDLEVGVGDPQAPLEARDHSR